jgi:hypothetical protein
VNAGALPAPSARRPSTFSMHTQAAGRDPAEQFGEGGSNHSRLSGCGTSATLAALASWSASRAIGDAALSVARLRLGELARERFVNPAHLDWTTPLASNSGGIGSTTPPSSCAPSLRVVGRCPALYARTDSTLCDYLLITRVLERDERQDGGENVQTFLARRSASRSSHCADERS